MVNSTSARALRAVSCRFDGDDAGRAPSVVARKTPERRGRDADDGREDIHPAVGTSGVLDFDDQAASRGVHVYLDGVHTEARAWSKV